MPLENDIVEGCLCIPFVRPSVRSSVRPFVGAGLWHEYMRLAMPNALLAMPCSLFMAYCLLLAAYVLPTAALLFYKFECAVLCPLVSAVASSRPFVVSVQNAAPRCAAPRSQVAIGNRCCVRHVDMLGFRTSAWALDGLVGWDGGRVVEERFYC